MVGSGVGVGSGFPDLVLAGDRDVVEPDGAGGHARVEVQEGGGVGGGGVEGEGELLPGGGEGGGGGEIDGVGGGGLLEGDGQGCGARMPWPGSEIR